MQEFPTAREAVRPPHVTVREIWELAAAKTSPASRVARKRRYPWELFEAWIRQRVEYAGEAKAPPARPPAVFARACSTS